MGSELRWDFQFSRETAFPYDLSLIRSPLSYVRFDYCAMLCRLSIPDSNLQEEEIAIVALRYY